VTRVGRYVLETALARGGMAELHVARLVDDEGFARRVALKRALPELRRDRGFAEMFRAEARLAASLAHHNIVAVHDLGEDDQGLYFVMELLHGADVGAVLRASPAPIPLPIVLAIASDACAGLHHAHERRGVDGEPLGIIHRDISPQNLFVTFDGCTKLLDFGIAKAIDKIRDLETRTGTLRGKVPYMSPEQCRGEPLDRRTDVFSLGIVLWELVTGERLYGARGESEFEIFKQIAERDAPDPIERRADTPPALARVILRALARDREQRYPTIAALHDELDALAKATPLATPREVGAYVATLFPDRAEAWKRGTLAAGIAPRVTAELPAAPTRELRSGDSAPVDFELPQTRQSPNASTITRVPTVPPVEPTRSRAWLAPVLLVAVAGAVVAGYVAGTRRSESAPPTPSSPGPTSIVATTPPPAPGFDAMWFKPDDYLVSAYPYAGYRLNRLRVGSLLGAAPAVGVPGHFVDTVGQEYQTAAYWQTRIATRQDLAVGTLAFCHLVVNMSEGTTPENRDDARLGDWTLARITDIDELASGWIRIADARCPVGGVRVAR